MQGRPEEVCGWCVIDTAYYHLYAFILILFALFIGSIECEVHNRTWNLERYLRSGLKQYQAG